MGYGLSDLIHFNMFFIDIADAEFVLESQTQMLEVNPNLLKMYNYIYPEIQERLRYTEYEYILRGIKKIEPDFIGDKERIEFDLKIIYN